MTPEQFWSNVDQSAGPTGCWPWTRGMAKSGYGAVRLNGRFINTHRAAFLLKHGRSVADGKYACHTCDNRACCNPAHIYEGTPLDNSRDMTGRGRAAWQNATTCAKGHAWTSANEMSIPGTSWRRCRECHRDQGRRAAARYRAKIKAMA